MIRVPFKQASGGRQPLVSSGLDVRWDQRADAPRSRLVVASILCLALTSSEAAAEPVLVVSEGEICWGFDGTVMRDRFNPLTIVVDNPSPEAFDGQIRLHRADFSGRRVGGFHVETIYLAPGTRRAVQFYPLALSEMENWVVSWDGGEVTLPPAKLGPPARVLLVDADDLFDRGGAVKRFPSRSFPSYVTATEGLAEVVIDTPPEWAAQQRQSFLDWLKSGGVVHLIHGPDGRHPQFSGDLALLNEPSDEFRIGAGRVKRHAVPRSGLTPDYVRAQVDPPAAPADEVPTEVERGQDFGAYQFSLAEWRMTTAVINRLKRMVKVEHNWGVIHLLSLSYVAVLFPGCFLIGREFRNVPATFGAIAGSTLLFGAAFFLVGNRGYGESVTVRSLALAEHIEGDRFDVTEWSSVFVTEGGDYAFSHSGTERLYSDATENEAVGGGLTSGADGRFIVDVPPYSTRVMAHKAIVRIPKAAAPKVERDAGGAVSFRLPPGFPKEIEDAYVVIGRRVISCRRNGELLTPTGQGSRAKEFLKVRDSDYAYDYGGWEENPEAEAKLDPMVQPLILYALRLTADAELKDFSVPEGRAKLFVRSTLGEAFRTLAAEAPTEQDAEGPAPEPLGGQEGSVLYSFDLAL